MKKRLLILLIGASLVLAACGDDQASEAGSLGEANLTIEEVKSVYSQNCASCHGQILANGIPGDLDKIGAELSKEEIETTIRKGRGMMKGGLVEGNEAASLVDWLSTLK